MKYFWIVLSVLVLGFTASTYPIWNKGKEVSLLNTTAVTAHRVNNLVTKKENHSKHLASLVCKKCHPYTYKLTAWAYMYKRYVLKMKDSNPQKAELKQMKAEHKATVEEKKQEIKDLKATYKEKAKLLEENLDKQKKEMKAKIKDMKKEIKEMKKMQEAEEKAQSEG